MSHLVFPQKKPSMSMQQAFQQTIAHCQAGEWGEAEILYQAIVQAQPSPLQAQYWLSYIDALIQTGKPRPAAPVPARSEVPASPAPALAAEVAVNIKVARPPNPCYTAKLPRYPWKMAIGNNHVPSRQQIHLLLAHYERARYDEAEALARDLTCAYPLHDLGWKVLVAALQKQGRIAESQQAQTQRRLSRNAVRRKNVRQASVTTQI